jgi:hypothetical protein
MAKSLVASVNKENIAGRRLHIYPAAPGEPLCGHDTVGIFNRAAVREPGLGHGYVSPQKHYLSSSRLSHLLDWPSKYSLVTLDDWTGPYWAIMMCTSRKYQARPTGLRRVWYPSWPCGTCLGALRSPVYPRPRIRMRNRKVEGR